MIVLSSAIIGSQLSTSGGLGQVTSGLVEEDDASRDESAAAPSADEVGEDGSYVVVGEDSAPEGMMIFVEEDSELGRALAESGASDKGDQADKDKDSSDDEGGFPIVRPKP